MNIDWARVESWNQSQRPRIVIKLRSFLGLYNLHWRFVPVYIDIEAPMIKFLCNGQPKDLQGLDKPEVQAFEKPIQITSAERILALPLPDLLFVFDKDASDYQVGVALFQVYSDEEQKQVEFRSWSLNLHEMIDSVLEKIVCM